MSTEFAQLQRRLRVRFRNEALLAQSLIHRSYLNEALDPGVESNERMEFLGDAVLGAVVAEWLYARYPELSEGRLTELRAHIVKGETLAAVGARLDLGSFMYLGRGEAATGGRRREMNLARALEAIIGAVFQDKGYNATRRWLLKLLEPELTGLGGGELQVDAKSRLQHTAQVLYGTTPRYRVLSIDGPDHEKVFTVEVTLSERQIATGQGRNKRYAERAAAAAAMAAIELEHPEIAADA